MKAAKGASTALSQAAAAKWAAAQAAATNLAAAKLATPVNGQQEQLLQPAVADPSAASRSTGTVSAAVVAAATPATTSATAGGTPGGWNSQGVQPQLQGRPADANSHLASRAAEEESGSAQGLAHREAEEGRIVGGAGAQATVRDADGAHGSQAQQQRDEGVEQQEVWTKVRCRGCGRQMGWGG